MPTIGPSRDLLSRLLRAVTRCPNGRTSSRFRSSSACSYFADPAKRRELNAIAHSPEAGALRGLASWANLEIGETFSPGNAGLAGRIGARRRA